MPMRNNFKPLLQNKPIESKDSNKKRGHSIDPREAQYQVGFNNHGSDMSVSQYAQNYIGVN